MVTFPLQPVLPKNIPLAIASFLPRVTTLATFSLNFLSSWAKASKAWTVRRADNDSVAILMHTQHMVSLNYDRQNYLSHITYSFLRLVGQLFEIATIEDLAFV